MKKFISVVLLVAIVVSCFSITSTAACSHNARYEAQQTYHPYDSICHVLRIKYICTNCGSVVHIEEHEQVHSDRNGDGYCDYCYYGSGSSGGSSSATQGGGFFEGLGNILGAIIGIPLKIISFPFVLILSLFGF
jgi:hypothetical protein